jgi:5-(aminomethyl)-3-furanmethanol phosphate kinase
LVVVVKLGGSLAASGMLRSSLRVIERYGAGRCVVVPGGGDFAEAVRVAQRHHGFSASAAHRMALLAMHQYGLLLADWAPSLQLCQTDEEMRNELAAGRIALWLPSRMALADPAIAESWEVTSDSLAAWLARRLDADRLILVKSAPPPPPPLSPILLAQQGLVDPAFPAYVLGARFKLGYCGPGGAYALAKEIEAE